MKYNKNNILGIILWTYGILQVVIFATYWIYRIITN